MRARRRRGAAASVATSALCRQSVDARALSRGAAASGRARDGAWSRASISSPPSLVASLYPPLRSPPGAVRTYVNHYDDCLYFIIGYFNGCESLFDACVRRGGVRCEPYDLSSRRASDNDTLIDLVLGILFCFEFNSI